VHDHDERLMPHQGSGVFVFFRTGVRIQSEAVSFHQRPGQSAGGSWNGIVFLNKTGSTVRLNGGSSQKNRS
jgi:hypothetical protein